MGLLDREEMGELVAGDIGVLRESIEIMDETLKKLCSCPLEAVLDGLGGCNYSCLAGIARAKVWGR